MSGLVYIPTHNSLGYLFPSHSCQNLLVFLLLFFFFIFNENHSNWGVMNIEPSLLTQPITWLSLSLSSPR